MKVRYLAALVAAVLLSATANAELNTVQYISHDGGGEGRLDIDGNRGDLLDSGLGPMAVDLSGASNYTLLDGEGGDMWNGGDQFTYLYDSNKVTGDFTATVRVVSQTESVEGRWGKVNLTAQANLSGLGQGAATQVYSGTGSQIDPPAAGDHSPIPVRIGGRTGVDGTGGFERAISNAGGEIPNNTFPEATANVINPPTNVSWLRLQYKADSNQFLGAFASDVDGAPGEWGYSAPVTDVPVPSADDGEGWFVGIGYSAHNSLQVAELEDDDFLHGVGFDNYSIVPEYLKPEISVGGTGIGSLEVGGVQSNLVTGDPVTQQGLASYWFAGNMRPGSGGVEAFLDVGTTGNEDFPLLNPGGAAVVLENTWWRGANGTSGLTDIELVDYPGAITGAAGWDNGDNYGVKVQGEIFIEEDGTYMIRDGIDDFAMVAIDADGNGELDGLNDLIDGDEGTLGGFSLDDVHVLDDDWANFDGGSQEEGFHGFAEIENVDAGGEWRKIEIWMSEAGGGDAGIVYIANEDDPDAFDSLETGGLSQEQRDAFVVKPDALRSTTAPIVGGDSVGSLDPDVLYVVQATADGADSISVADGDGVLTSTLDVSGASVRVDADGLADGTVITLFDVDAVTGTDSLTLELADPGSWDLSNLANGEITFGAGGGPICDATTGGDINGDGSVGFPDFLILSANFGNAVSGAGHLEGDIDCSGDVAFADFLVLSNAFGTTVGAEASSVPEPSSLALLGLAGLFAGMFRRRR